MPDTEWNTLLEVFQRLAVKHVKAVATGPYVQGEGDLAKKYYGAALGNSEALEQLLRSGEGRKEICAEMGWTRKE